MTTTRQRTNLDNALDTIMGLDSTDDLDAVFNAYKARTKQVRNARNASAASTFHVGDRVVFNATASPKYLRGVGATVKDVRATRLQLQVDETPAARRMAGALVTGPASLVEVAR